LHHSFICSLQKKSLAVIVCTDDKYNTEENTIIDQTLSHRAKITTDHSVVHLQTLQCPIFHGGLVVKEEYSYLMLIDSKKCPRESHETIDTCKNRAA